MVSPASKLGNPMNVPKFRTLKEWSKAFDGHIPASTLRAEVHAGNLKAIRARSSCNAPILISDREMERWLENVAGKRTRALSPSEASSASNSGDHDDS